MSKQCRSLYAKTFPKDLITELYGIPLFFFPLAATSQWYAFRIKHVRKRNMCEKWNLCDFNGTEQKMAPETERPTKNFKWIFLLTQIRGMRIGSVVLVTHTGTQTQTLFVLSDFSAFFILFDRLLLNCKWKFACSNSVVQLEYHYRSHQNEEKVSRENGIEKKTSRCPVISRVCVAHFQVLFFWNWVTKLWL